MSMEYVLTFKMLIPVHTGVFLVVIICLYFYCFGSHRPHVWGQFCLCYDGQKLVAETDHLRNYGIKDGDQVCNFYSFTVITDQA